MKRQFLFGTMLSAALAVGVAAQQPQGGQTTGTAGADQGQAGRSGQTITVTGCLQRGGQMAGATGTQPGATGTQPGATAGTAGTGAQAGYILTNVSPAGAGAGAGAAGTQPGQTGTQPGQTGTRPDQTGTQAGQPGQTTQPGQTPQPGQPGQAGQPGTAAGTTGARASSYRLTGGEDQNLQKHVGQRVEVTGTMTPATGAGAKTGAGTGADRPTTGQTGQTPGQTGTTPGQTGTTPGQTGQTGAGATTAQAQAGAQAAMPTLRVTSVRQVSGNCP